MDHGGIQRDGTPPVRPHRDPRHLGLLQHDFRDDNVIRIARAAPGQRALVRVIVLKHKALECADGGGRARLRGKAADQQALAVQFSMHGCSFQELQCLLMPQRGKGI